MLAAPEFLLVARAWRSCGLVGTGDDAIRVSGPDEALGSLAVLGDEAVDSGLKIDDAAEAAPAQALAGQLGEEALTAVSHDAEVGVKWKTHHGCFSNKERTFGCLWVA
jgi:hypothetical protein